MTIIKDEATDLLALYGFHQLFVIAYKDILTQHLNRFGRIGFGVGRRHGTAEDIFEYFSSKTKEELAAEKVFVERVLNSDLEQLIFKGFKIGRSTLPNAQYTDPVAVLLIDGSGTDAAVINETEFGINLTQFWDREVGRQNPDRAVREGLDRIMSAAAHESNHIYLEQARGTTAHMLYEKLFLEGLATFTEPIHYEQHHDYLKELRLWEEIIFKATENITADERKELYRKAAKSEALRKHRPQIITKIGMIEQSISGQREIEQLAKEVLIDGNGPIYHVGYHMWKTIADTHGIEKVKELAKDGPAKFLAAYQSIEKGRQAIAK